MPNISLFKSVTQPDNPISLDLIEQLEKTRDGEWEDIVTKCRLLKTKEDRDSMKKTMPTVTYSGTFSRRADSSIVERSGILAMDLDYVENINDVKKAFENDKFVFSVFFSTSGYGLRVLFAIDPFKHRESFIAISKYIFDKYGQLPDQNGVSLSKPYVVSFDPFLYLNPLETPQWKKFEKEKDVIQKKEPYFVHIKEDFENVIKTIVERNINICEDYEDYRKVGFALSSGMGEDGRPYFHKVTKVSSKYKYIEVDKHYTSFMRANGSSKINMSSFYFLAKQQGISISSEKTRLVVKQTKNGKSAGLKKETIIRGLEKYHGITGVDDLVEQVFDKDISDEYDDEEKSIIPQLEMFISNNYSLKMNDVTGYLEQDDKPLYDTDLNSIFISAKKMINQLDYNLMMRLLKSDFVEKYNPFIKFLGSDGIAVRLPAIPSQNQPVPESPLIDLLSSTIKNDNPSYTSYFTRKWIVSIISAMHKVHSPLLHCLLGSQGTGKTEWYRRLLPNELQPYFQKSSLDRGKDDELLMCENILIIDELAGKSKSDSIKLNGLTSSDYFSLRRPYGDHNEKVLRYAVLCGTSNYPKGVLADPTGNRRIIPIDVNDVDKDLYNSIDKKELFLEAFKLYKEGFDWRVNPHDRDYLNKDKDKYEMIIKEKELIEQYFMPSDKDDRMTTTDILVELERLTNQRLSINVVGRELEKGGFERKTTRDGISTIKKWCVKKINRNGQVARWDNPEAQVPNPF
jgi:hypothetical protein